MAPPMRNNNTKLQWVPRPSVGLHLLHTHTIKTPRRLPTSLQLSTLEVGSRAFKVHNTSQEATVTRRINNQQSPVFRVVAYRVCVISVVHFGVGLPGITLNIITKVIIICLIYFNTWGQVNLMMLALKSGPKSRQKLVMRPDYCAGESGILSENLGCSG